MSQQERKIDQELKDIKYNLKNYEFQIIEVTDDLFKNSIL